MKPRAAATPAPAAVPPKWIQRTDLELEAALRQACRRAADRDAEVLLEFGAPWCVDCRALQALEPQLTEELERYERVVVDVGRFDRHELFLRAFEVGSIAHWVILEPSQCDSPPPAWPRRRQGTVELATGTTGPRTAEEVRSWLR